MKKILLAMTAYGPHIDLFLNYGLPSLMANGNLPSLAKEREILINIHTDKQGFVKLFGKVPYINEIIVDVDNSDKYEQLGKHQNQDLREAKKLGADYHTLMPDYIYSDNCFAGILKASEQHKAIVRLVVSSIEEEMLPELSRPRSAIDLATLAFQHRHQGIRNWFVTPTGYPGTHVVAFVGNDTIKMQSPHCSPVYIANEAINTIDGNMPLDCILDQIIIGDIYCPKPEDGIVIIELSPREARRLQNECVSLEEFCRIMAWDTKNSLRQFHIFNQETIDAIHPQDNYWEDKDIENIQKTVYDALNKHIGG